VIRRVLVANRGEIALRIVRACRELGIESVAVYSDADRELPFVAATDRAVRIGPPPAAESYLNVEAILKAAKDTAADAVHPGYGFLSERARFARACENAGLVFVGPPASALERMGSKTGARQLMQSAGVPVVPGLTPPDQSDDAIRAAVLRVGLPALLKPAAGGGGIGMKTLRAESDIDEAVARARREALAAFGDGTLYVERLIEQPRHVEIQVLADTHGNYVHLFERECSVQRRHQKVIEESPCAALTPAMRRKMGEAAVKAARAVRYVNAGTVEFLLEGTGDAARFYFLEMNTRLQVEHPVTECVVGIDLVHAQLRIASGEPLPWRQEDVTGRGHAIECRVYAEDPSQGFLPQAGSLLRFREPQGPGIRVDSGYAEGNEVSVYYDPLIAKVIVSAETRNVAIARAKAALRDFEIDGIETNVPFLRQILEHPRFAAADLDTNFLDTEGDSLAALAIASTRSTIRTRTSTIAPPHPSTLARAVADPFETLPGWRVGAGGETAPTATSARRAPRARARARADNMAAPMPATVIKILVEPGTRVAKGDLVVLLEAMKMELPIKASRDGVVRALLCRPGELVQPGVSLVELEP
jgi:acetyl-CoA carboxylase biotin carboxylase subunit